MAWYVVKTRVRQELRAVTHLQNQSFEAYCPWLVHKDGAKEALFAGYLFVQLNQFTETYYRIRSTRGVQSLLKFGDWWAKVDDAFIHYLQENESRYQNVPLFQKNQEVVIKDGPFKGIEAVYLSADGEERAVVLLTILHRKQSFSIEEHLLKAL